MVEVFEGRIGGGKTYSAVVRILAHLAAGGTVATNVELIWEGCLRFVQRVYGVTLEREQLIMLKDEEITQFHKYTPSGSSEMSVLVVLDEVHLHFNARDFGSNDKNFRETFTFLTQSRKVCTDVIFISQSMFNIDKQFVRQVQYIWRFRDMSKWRIPGLGIASPFKGILAVQFDLDGKTILQREFVPKNKAVFQCYNTNALLRPFPRLGQAGKRQLKKKEQPLIQKITALVVLADLVLVGLLLAKIFRVL